MEIMQMQFAAKSTIIRQFIDEHRTWMESVLQTPANDLMQLRLDVSLAGYLSHGFLERADVPLSADGSKAFPLQAVRMETPSGFLPAISLHAITIQRHAFGARHTWGEQWLDCPAALHIDGLPRPVVVLHIPYIEGGESHTGWREVIVLAIQDIAGFLEKIRTMLDDSQPPTVDILGMGYAKVAPTRWEDLILDATANQLLREDFENFFEREEWFRTHRLPYRRGYLLHGPPGNGKTSAIRAMLSRPGVHGHSVNLFQRDLEDNDLMAMFHRAAERSPAVIVLEDLDRCLSPVEQEAQNQRINLQTLLNCLDGITTQDGVVVVATRTIQRNWIRRSCGDRDASTGSWSFATQRRNCEAAT